MITETLARFVAETPLDAIPAEAYARAVDCLVDGYGVALAGATEPVSRIALRLAGQSRTGDAAIWGTLWRASAKEAAFANAIQLHALDFDDTSVSMRGHPTASLMPAAVAAGEMVGASGREVLAAYLLGLEVAVRVTAAWGPAHYRGGWHGTATSGTFGATVAAARLLGLDVSAMRNAFGLTASQIGGLSKNFGTMTKPFHAGHAASTGVHSAHLAREGFTANPSVFEGEHNVLTVYGAETSVIADEALASLGRRWEILDPGLKFKKWPSCFGMHRPVAGLLALKAREGFDAGDVRSIAIGFQPGAAHPLKHVAPKTALEGKFSVEYGFAAALLDGDMSMRSFTDEMVQRPEAQALIARVSRYDLPGEGVFNGNIGYHELKVETRTGSHSMHLDEHTVEWRLRPGEQDDKFLSCATLRMTDDEARQLLERLRGIEAAEAVLPIFA